MLGDLPPHSSDTRFMFERAAQAMMCLPVAVEPVKPMPSTSMCRASASPAVRPKPGTTLNTPFGTPAACASSASRSAVSGDFSEGLSTTELPAARMGPSFHAAMIIGKFHGTMAPTTPSGSRVTSASASCAVGATSPYTLSMLSANHWMQWAVEGTSTVSESVMGLPTSSVSVSASSSACSRIAAAKASSTPLRSRGGMRAHSPRSKASRALRTAASTSAASPEATRASTRPSTGLTLSKVAPECAGRNSPSMNTPSRGESAAARRCQSVGEVAVMG
jgi:hypothetical protein